MGMSRLSGSRFKAANLMAIDYGDGFDGDLMALYYDGEPGDYIRI
jgi:hypothetical protein